MNKTRKKIKTLLLIGLFTNNFYASDEIFPQEITEQIANSPGRAGLLQTNKHWHNWIFPKELKPYVDYVARTELFNQNFALDKFLDKKYDYLSEDTRKLCNTTYNELITNPVFFITFARIDNISVMDKVPDYIKKNLKIEGDGTNNIIQSKSKKEKLILYNPHVANQDLEEILAEMTHYLPITRLIFTDRSILPNKIDYNIDLCTSCIIQDNRFNFPFVNRIDIGPNVIRDEQGHILFDQITQIFNQDILKVKNAFGETLLFYYPKKCLTFNPYLYINERDKTGNTALCFILKNSKMFTNDEILENIDALIQNGIRIDLQDDDGNNALHYTIKNKNFKFLSLLKNGKNFHKALNQLDAQNQTPKDYPQRIYRVDLLSPLQEDIEELEQYNKSKDILLEEGAISGQDVQNGKTPLHVYAESGNDEIFLKIIQIPYYQQFINQEDNAGNTPLDYAYRSNNVQIIAALKTFKAKNSLAQQRLFRRLWFQKVGITIGVVGVLMLLYQNSKKYGWFSSIQQYLNPRKR